MEKLRGFEQELVRGPAEWPLLLLSYPADLHRRSHMAVAWVSRRANRERGMQVPSDVTAGDWSEW